MFFTSNLATLNTTSTPHPHSRPPSKTRSMRPPAPPQAEEAAHVQKAKSSRIEALKSDNRDLQPPPKPNTSSREYPKQDRN